MSQTETGKAVAAEERTEAARSFVRTVKAATRRKYTPEEKVRIVLEGFRREVTVSDLVQAGGNQASLLLLMDQGVHGGGQREAYPRHGAGRHPAGGTGTQAGERRAKAAGGGVVPGGVPSEKTAIPILHAAAGING